MVHKHKRLLGWMYFPENEEIQKKKDRRLNNPQNTKVSHIHEIQQRTERGGRSAKSKTMIAF